MQVVSIKAQPLGVHLKGGASATPGQQSRWTDGLSMYGELPNEDLTLEEFERLAVDRLRVLKGLEEAKQRNKSDEDLQELVNKLFQKHLKGVSREATARADELSHLILRLAHCRSADLRKWLITHECELFRLRFSALELTSDRVHFLQSNALPFSPVPDAELTDDLRRLLKNVMLAAGQSMEAASGLMADGQRTFYKVPFTSVPDLVAQRKVLLVQGYAYVGKQDLTSLVVQEFRLRLSKGLSDINRRWKDMFPDSDHRLRPLVASLAQRYLGVDYSGNQAAARHGEVHIGDLAALSLRHFPLCMTNLMTHLAGDHHLRHGGRQQLSLFLKAIGLPMEEALVFWRNSFAPRTMGEKFDKEYAYNIRHNYGKEGKRMDYSAHSCVSLIRQSGGREDHHGCPYRRLDETALRGLLAKVKCEDSKVEEALAKVRGGHYQIACGLVLEGVARAPCEAGVCHPVQYYSESRRLAEEREATKAQATPGVSTPQPMDTDAAAPNPKQPPPAAIFSWSSAANQAHLHTPKPAAAGAHSGMDVDGRGQGTGARAPTPPRMGQGR